MAMSQKCRHIKHDLVCDSHQAKTKVQPTPVQEICVKKGEVGAYSGMDDVLGFYSNTNNTII